MEFYTATTYSIDASGASSLALKQPGGSVMNITASGGSFSVSFPSPGRWWWQMQDAGGSVVSSGTWDVLQKLSSAPLDYDPRSIARRTLEAIEDKIAGRALSIQQSKITVGDRSIEYINSIDELLKWRDHFAREVAREEGRITPRVNFFELKRAGL